MKTRRRPTPAGRTARARVNVDPAVKRAVRKVRPELPDKALTPRASLVADLGIDSLKLAELSVALEDELHRPIFLGDVLADVDDPAALTLGDLSRLLARG